MSLSGIPGLLITAGAIGAQALAIPTAAAQTVAAPTAAQASEESGLEEIVVTARKREERVQDIPASISVLDAKTIETAGVNSFEDVTRLIPNLTVHQNFRAGQPFITLRGIPTAQGGEPPVAVLIDGVQQPSLDFVQQGLYDVADVQVLRGPQGALYGRGAIAGAVLIDTKRPTDQFEVRAVAFGGNDATYRVSSTLSGPIQTGKLWFRLTAAYRDNNGYNFDSTTHTKVDWSHEVTERLELLAEPLDALSLALRATHTQGSDGASDYQLVTAAQLNDFSILNPQNYPVVDQRKLDSISLKADWKTGVGTVTSISQYAKTTSFVQGDADFTAAPLLRQTEPGEVVAFNEDLRLTSNQTGPLQWLVGAFFQHRNSPLNLTVDPQPGGPLVGLTIPGLPFISDDFQQSRSYAVYGQTVYRFADVYEATAALRYDVDRRFDEDINNPAATAIRHTFSAWQPTLTLKRTLGSNSQGYITYGQGFRSGGFNPAADVASTGVARIYPKETTRNYEIGVKSEWLDGRVTVNASVFRMNFADQQFFFVVVSPPSRDIVSFPKTHIDGGELEIQARPIRELTLNAGVGVSHSIIDRSQSAQYDGNYSPLNNKYTFNVSAEYRHRLFANVDGLIRADYDGLGHVYWDQSNTFGQGPVQVLGGRIGIGSDQWTLSVLGRNLTDRRYAELVTPFSTATGFNGYGRLPNQPRTYGVELAVKL